MSVCGLIALGEQKYVADFYISDFQSGLRALVKTGYGAKVAPFVEPATVVDVKQENRDLSPSFLRWLADRNLSSDDRIMRLKEGYGLNEALHKMIHSFIDGCTMFSWLHASKISRISGISKKGAL